MHARTHTMCAHIRRNARAHPKIMKKKDEGHIRTCAHRHTHTRAHTQKCMGMHPRGLTHTRTHAHAHTLARTRTHHDDKVAQPHLCDGMVDIAAVDPAAARPVRPAVRAQQTGQRPARRHGGDCRGYVCCGHQAGQTGRTGRSDWSDERSECQGQRRQGRRRWRQGRKRWADGDDSVKAYRQAVTNHCDQPIVT